MAEVKFEVGDCLKITKFDVKVGDQLKNLNIKPEEIKVSAKSNCPEGKIEPEEYCLLLNDENFDNKQNKLTLDQLTILVKGNCNRLNDCTTLRSQPSNISTMDPSSILSSIASNIPMLQSQNETPKNTETENEEVPPAPTGREEEKIPETTNENANDTTVQQQQQRSMVSNTIHAFLS